MSNTANYNWNIPDNTDLVKDGALAIRTLGNAIDTSMNTALGTRKAGMVLLNTTSFSGVSSQSVNSVFSATYDNYKIVLSNLIGSGSNSALTFRLRKSGTDNSSNIYHRQYQSAAGPTAELARTQSTSFFLLNVDSGGTNMTVLDITLPFVSTSRTSMIGTTMGQPVNDIIIWNNAYSHDLATSADFDGFTLITASGTMSGNVSVYGYNK